MLEGEQRKHSLEYRPAIDGLRAISVLGVVIFHLNRKWLPGGFVGVDVFFVISGFLITSIIYGEALEKRFSFARFYQRRIARIFPAFFATAAITVTVAAILYTPQDLASAGANLAASALSLANMKLMLQGNYFEISPDAQPLLHYWSLSVEEQYYVLFPVGLLLLLKYQRKRVGLVLGIVCGLSLVICVVLTRIKPIWAFYLLPTRFWELGVGSLLAVYTAGGQTTGQSKLSNWTAEAGLLLVALSFVFIRETTSFPGIIAAFPVAGAAGILFAAGTPSAVERLLSRPIFLAVGRASYSLYLWHWPVFAFVDYAGYFRPESFRMVLKIAITAAATLLSFWGLEQPSRKFLNLARNARVAYAFVIFSILASVCLGIYLRKDNYVNAELRDVREGGLVFNKGAKGKSVVLMGDSNGSMYGKTLKSICKDLDYKLTVISVAAGDPLPNEAGEGELWRDCVNVLKSEHPDFLVLVCNWADKLRESRGRLEKSIAAVRPLAKKVILLTQPPELPPTATRASIRAGAEAPFYEDVAEREVRQTINRYVISLSSPDVMTIDVAPLFEGEGNTLIFTDENRKALFHDRLHLSGYGADRVRGLIVKALAK